MRSPHLLLIALAGLTILAGCHRADSLAARQRDVNQPKTQATIEESRSSGRLTNTETNADRAADRADQRVANGAYTEAVTDAEASYRISVAQCQSLAGDAQKACQAEADGTLARAKAYAQASLAHRE